MPHLKIVMVLLLGLSVSCLSAAESTGDAPVGDSSDATTADAPAGGDASTPIDDDHEDDASSEPDTTDNSEDTQDEEGVPSEGFGVISGACGLIDNALREQIEPTMIQNAIDFLDDPYDELDYELLSDGGREIVSDGNAGGSSLYSEVFAFEVLARCEGAVLLKTETEILYQDPQGKMTDLLVSLDGVQVGVSVTRAVGFPREDPYTVEQAQGLLEQKLDGILASSANVTEVDGWDKQILHIIAYAPEHAESLGAAFELVDPVLQGNTIVYITVSNGDDFFLY